MRNVIVDLHVESVPYSSFSSSNEYCTSVKTKLYTSIILINSSYFAALIFNNG